MTDFSGAEPHPKDDSGGFCCVAAGMHMGHDEDCPGYPFEPESSRELFDTLPSNGKQACPDCGSRQTHPRPGCSCPYRRTNNGFGYTEHINREHHTCGWTP